MRWTVKKLLLETCLLRLNRGNQFSCMISRCLSQFAICWCRLSIIASLILMVGCSVTEQISDSKTLYGDVNPQQAAKFNLQLGLGYLEQGDVERAKGKLLKAVKQAPTMPEAHYNIAHFYYLIDETKLADEHFRKAIELAKNNTKGVLGTARNNFGVFLCQTKHYQEAEYQFLQAVMDNDYADSASAYENAGLCSLKAGKKIQAKSYFEKAIKQNPLATKALIELAELNFDAKQYEKAIFYLGRYDQLTNGSQRSMLLSFKIAKEQGQDKKALDLLTKLLDKYPDLKNSKDISESYSKNNKSIYNNKLVKYTEIGELKTINSIASHERNNHALG